MFGAGFEPHAWEIVRITAVIVLMGGVIKLMDDFLDLRYDVFVGSQSLAMRLGEGTLPYALMGFTFAVILDPTLAAAIMIGAYAAGMAGEYDRQLPSGLSGYQEAFLVLCFAFAFIPWPHVTWAIFIMLAIQLADDLYDLEADRCSGNPNLVRKLGRVESHMLGAGSLVAAALLNPGATALAFASVPLVLWVFGTVGRPAWPNRGWSR